jgi:hypothetical protein
MDKVKKNRIINKSDFSDIRFNYSFIYFRYFIYLIFIKKIFNFLIKLIKLFRF